MYEYANPVTVWNLVMNGKCCRHLSLRRGHCFMPGSWAQLLLRAPCHPAQTLLPSCSNLEPIRSLARRIRVHRYTPAYVAHERKACNFYFCGLLLRQCRNPTTFKGPLLYPLSYLVLFFSSRTPVEHHMINYEKKKSKTSTHLAPCLQLPVKSLSFSFLFGKGRNKVEQTLG